MRIRSLPPCMLAHNQNPNHDRPTEYFRSCSCSPVSKIRACRLHYVLRQLEHVLPVLSKFVVPSFNERDRERCNE
eukprot:4013972-Amphidinium_carterae.1